MSRVLSIMMKRSRKLLIALWVVFSAFGFLASSFGPPVSGHGSFDLVFAVCIAICLFAWCKADATERGISPGSAPALCGLVPPLGLLYYFFRFLPLRQAGLASMKALGFVLLLLFSYGLAAFSGERVSVRHWTSANALSIYASQLA
ncbi:MAG: hypothetical protein M0P19_02715 [Nevskia sp.]|jgi:hypothetical protein|nr:hypothetical protein [Nevskia sp.]MCK9383880.1 hypothetical protein [Nevskia sp.]